MRQQTIAHTPRAGVPTISIGPLAVESREITTERQSGFVELSMADEQDLSGVPQIRFQTGASDKLRL